MPGARLDSSGVIIIGVLLTMATLPHSEVPSTVATHAAIGVGLTLILSAFMDLRDGMSNLLRADLLALAAFYLLTLLEFLFPQPHFDMEIDAAGTREGLQVLWVAFIGLAVGRHLWRPKRQPFGALVTQPLEARKLIFLFMVCAFLGYFHMLLAVNFNVVNMADLMMGPRFTQPWGRGRLGDWKALVGELALLIQLLPPITGMILARPGRYSRSQYVPVYAICLFTLFYAFTSGTRNLLASYLVTFAIGYGLALLPEKKFRIMPMLAVCAVLFLACSWTMLQFRNMGFKNWLNSSSYTVVEESQRTLAVDYNLLTVCRLTQYFPVHHNFLGGEIVWMAIVRPIPRALWPGKPVDMSMTIEDVLGMSGLTISATYAGEAYMAGGLMAVLIFSLFLGGVTGWWNSLASARNSELGMLVYSSGFFTAVITMRSIYEFTTAILPTIAGLVTVWVFAKMTAAGLQRLSALSRAVSPGGTTVSRSVTRRLRHPLLPPRV